MRVEQTIRCLSGYAAPPPHPGPLPQGERELHCACRAPAVFAPSPLTGEGWDEGGADNSVFKRLRRPPPSPWPSPTRGEGIALCLPSTGCFCSFSLDGRRLG